MNEIVIYFPKYSFHDDLIISKAGGLMCYIVLLKKMWLVINLPYSAIFVEVLNTRCLPKLTGFKNIHPFFPAIFYTTLEHQWGYCYSEI